jgi:polyisoprenoid-binding protein YceI
MIKYAVLFLVSVFAVVLSLAIPGKPAVAPMGAYQVDAQHSDALLLTDATTNYGKTKINFTIGIARVMGKVKFDNDAPTKSSFDFTMYPSTSMAPVIGEDGKVLSQWFANLANHTLVCFHSKGFVRTSDGRLRTTGNLVVTRVDRNVQYNPGEDYAGPVYGPPMIHRVPHEATFIFDAPAVASATGEKNDPKDGEILLTSGSTNVITEDFPQLFKTVVSTYWPPVVQDENCQTPSAVGEDYSGPHCTGTFLHASGLPEEPRTTGEDYPGTSSNNFSAVVGNRLIISVHMRLKPVGQQAQAGGQTGAQD